MIGAIAKLLDEDTAGEPTGGLKWTRRTTDKIADELRSLGLELSATTVGRLLRGMGYSLRVAHKKLCAGIPKSRDRQFQYIAALRNAFSRRGRPIVSVDTKKRELVGKFKNPGRSWQREPIAVNVYDFRSEAVGIAIPYGVYDVQAKRGSIFVGVSHDTPAFAVASVEKWWRYDGRHRYPDARHLLVLADGGGSNGSRTHAWKYALQRQLCDRYGLTVTVSHYPSGASKWNPIEHHLFSEISKNWAGRPLDSYQTILNYIRTTRTRHGLRVKAYLDLKTYPKDVRIPVHQLARVRCQKHTTLSDWNYTIRPRNGK